MAWFDGDYPTIAALTDNDLMLISQGGSTGINTLATLKAYLAITSANIINSDSTVAGTPGTLVETTLRSFSIPAATLSTDGWFIRAIYWGTCANNANSKTIRFKFGATPPYNVFNSGTGSISGGWILESIVRRTSAGTQDMITKILGSKGTTWNTAIGGFVDFAEPAENLNGAVTSSLTGENGFASGSEIRYEGSIILLNS